MAQWVAFLTFIVQAWIRTPSENPLFPLARNFIFVAENAWFQEERIPEWFHNRNEINWGHYCWLTLMSNKLTFQSKPKTLDFVSWVPLFSYNGLFSSFRFGFTNIYLSIFTIVVCVVNEECTAQRAECKDDTCQCVPGFSPESNNANECARK